MVFDGTKQDFWIFCWFLVFFCSFLMLVVSPSNRDCWKVVGKSPFWDKVVWWGWFEDHLLVSLS